MAIGVQVEEQEIDGKTVLRISGRIDAASTPVLENKIKKVLDSKEKIVMDFSKVDYLSSAGMRLLLSATKKLKAKQGMLAICNMNEEVMEIIKMAAFERILAIYPTEAEALKALSK